MASLSHSAAMAIDVKRLLYRKYAAEIIGWHALVRKMAGRMGIVPSLVKSAPTEPVTRVRLSTVPKPTAQLSPLFCTDVRTLIPHAKRKPQTPNNIR